MSRAHILAATVAVLTAAGAMLGCKPEQPNVKTLSSPPRGESPHLQQEIDEGPLTPEANFDWGYPGGRAWVYFNRDNVKDYCRVIGVPNSRYIACTMGRKMDTVSPTGLTITFGPLDWGYEEGRSWADVNGDGRVDYCRVVGNGYPDSYVKVTFANTDGSGFGETIASPPIDWGYPTGRDWVDVNGDGRADYCRVVGTNPYQLRCLMSAGMTFGTEVTSANVDRGYEDGRAWFDIDRNGTADYCRVVGNPGEGVVSCALSITPILAASEARSDLLDWGYPGSRTWADMNGDDALDFCRAVGEIGNPHVRCLSTTRGPAPFVKEIEFANPLTRPTAALHVDIATAQTRKLSAVHTKALEWMIKQVAKKVAGKAFREGKMGRPEDFPHERETKERMERWEKMKDGPAYKGDFPRDFEKRAKNKV